MRRKPIVLSEGSVRRDRACSPPRGDDLDRPELLYDDWFAFGISALYPVAARFVVGPDDVRDVGVGNERHYTVRPSGSGVGAEVDNGHCKSLPLLVVAKNAASFVIEVATWIDPKLERIRQRVVLIFTFGNASEPLSMRRWSH
jgi:hypothetical protein